MLLAALTRYAFPALIVGSLGGYFVGRAASAPHTEDKKSLREQFLSSKVDTFDYDKLARVCLNSARRATRSQADPARGVADSDEVYDSTKVDETKGRLDGVMAASIERGTWTRGAGMIARSLMGRLPPSDAADFERLLRTTVEQGEVQVQPGAWIPFRLD